MKKYHERNIPIRHVIIVHLIYIYIYITIQWTWILSEYISYFSLEFISILAVYSKQYINSINKNDLIAFHKRGYRDDI